jgi:hypothetical protein
LNACCASQPSGKLIGCCIEAVLKPLGHAALEVARPLPGRKGMVKPLPAWPMLLLRLPRATLLLPRGRLSESAVGLGLKSPPPVGVRPIAWSFVGLTGLLPGLSCELSRDDRCVVLSAPVSAPLIRSTRRAAAALIWRRMGRAGRRRATCMPLSGFKRLCCGTHDAQRHGESWGVICGDVIKEAWDGAGLHRPVLDNTGSTCVICRQQPGARLLMSFHMLLGTTSVRPAEASAGASNSFETPRAAGMDGAGSVHICFRRVREPAIGPSSK